MKNKNSKRRYFFLDIIFIWGIILAPMTALRIFKFGPGEVLLILWMLIVFLKVRSLSMLAYSEVNKYQVANLLMMIVGMLVDILIYGTHDKFSVLATDYFSHLFMLLLSVSILNYFMDRDVEDINHVLTGIVVYGACVYGALLFYGTYISYSFRGYPLWLGDKTRFLGLAMNPHQIGMITGAGLFFALYLMSTTKVLWKLITLFIVSGIWLWVSRSLRSDTMTVCYVICLVVFVFLKLSKTEKNPTVRRRNFVLLAVLLFICLLVFAPKLLAVLSGFVKEAGNGEDRIIIWQAGLGQLKEKPIGFITGLGPGSHTGQYMLSGNEVEAHNTYVQLILDAGLIICIYYILTLYRLVKHPFIKNTYLVLAVLYFAFYGFGGNMNRRVLVWFTYTMVWLICGKTMNTEASQR